MRLFKLLLLMCAVVFALHAKANDNIIAIHGFNTMNSLLTPKLVESWCLSIPRATCQTRQGKEGSIVIDVSVAGEKRESFAIFAKGTETGQTALFAGQADIAAASDRYTAEQELQLVNVIFTSILTARAVSYRVRALQRHFADRLRSACDAHRSPVRR